MNVANATPNAAQGSHEVQAFVETFARITVRTIQDRLGAPLAEAAAAEQAVHPDWTDGAKLAASGLSMEQIDSEARLGRKYLHIDVATHPAGLRARQLFLGLTGLSDKQQKVIFPTLKSARPAGEALEPEISKLNAWLDEVRADGFDPSNFVTYQRAIGLHGSVQNLSGAIGAAGAVVTFVDALEQLAPGCIIDHVGELPPKDVRTPGDVYAWLSAGPNRTTKALLLSNKRAVVFAASKDVNIFQALGENQYSSAKDALKRFNSVAKNQEKREQALHEFAVGEVKTATDPANLHERLGLASRETQTELRTARFLLMALLTPEFLSGGTQRRTMNNRDLTRFTDVFNLHHCWGWDGGRERHPEHWEAFLAQVRRWCGV